MDWTRSIEPVRFDSVQNWSVSVRSRPRLCIPGSEVPVNPPRVNYDVVIAINEFWFCPTMPIRIFKDWCMKIDYVSWCGQKEAIRKYLSRSHCSSGKAV